MCDSTGNMLYGSVGQLYDRKGNDKTMQPAKTPPYVFCPYQIGYIFKFLPCYLLQSFWRYEVLCVHSRLWATWIIKQQFDYTKTIKTSINPLTEAISVLTTGRFDPPVLCPAVFQREASACCRSASKSCAALGAPQTARWWTRSLLLRSLM